MEGSNGTGQATRGSEKNTTEIMKFLTPEPRESVMMVSNDFNAPLAKRAGVQPERKQSRGMLWYTWQQGQ